MSKQVTERVHQALDEAKKLHQKGTTGIVASLYERVPLQRELNLLLNRYEEQNDASARTQLETQIRERQQAFHESRGGGHSNPDWILLTMDACIELTLGHVETALELDRRALEFAKTSWQRAVTLGNISDSLRHLGEYRKAVATSLEAVELDPGNDGFWAYLTMALFKSGQIDEAREIIRSVPKFSNVASSKSVWRAYLIAYNEFSEMKQRIPEINYLFEVISK